MPLFYDLKVFLEFLLLLGVGLTGDDQSCSLPTGVEVVELNIQRGTFQGNAMLFLEVRRERACVPRSVILSQQGTHIFSNLSGESTGAPWMDALFKRVQAALFIEVNGAFHRVGRHDAECCNLG